MIRALYSFDPVRMDVLLEHHARGPVQLAHDDALGAVDDERAELGQEREVTEVDFLLDDVLRTALSGVLGLHTLLEILPHDQTERRLERRRVRHVALDALLDGVLRLAERGGDVLEREVLVHVRDREDFPEHPVEPEVPLLLGRLGLDELLERPELDVEQVRHRHDRA